MCQKMTKGHYRPVGGVSSLCTFLAVSDFEDRELGLVSRLLVPRTVHS